MFNISQTIDSKQEHYKRQRKRWSNQRFNPQVATVDSTIVGRSDTPGKIKYYGGSYCRAVCYEPVTLNPGKRVKVLFRIPGRNILVVEPLSPLPVNGSPKPSPRRHSVHRTQKGIRSVAG